MLALRLSPILITITIFIIKRAIGARKKTPFHHQLLNICVALRDYRCPEFGSLAEFPSGLNFTRQMPSCVIPESDSIKATLPS